MANRAEFMIEGFRVGYEFGGGYRCGCAEFAVRGSCKHTREVAGRLAAQGRIAEHLKRADSKAYSPREVFPPDHRHLMR
jgi:hypothetical protein